MLFNSITYALFLPVVLALFYALRSARGRQALLLVASYAFYGAWDWRFLGLIALSTLVDFTVGLRLGSERVNRRALVAISIVTNLGILATFKYFDFFVASASALATQVGLRLNPPLLSIVLPVGISFYTFQTMAYTVDVYRRRIDPERSLRVFALYVAFFPQLVAGPIERARRLLPQLRELPGASTGDLPRGMELILVGLFKKLAIADGVAPVVDAVFTSPGSRTRTALIIGVVAFGLQIYGDFSGYTDIARGSARLLGVHLVENFRQPYLAKSITEFWRRWHISLSEWLRDYLYIPLGGSRGSRLGTMRNLMITMLLGGLWHGAAWSFVLWGAIHGLMLAIERVVGRTEVLSRTSIAWTPVTLTLVMAAWVPFRAGSLDGTLEYLGALVAGAGVDSIGPASLVIVLFALGATLLLDLSQERSGIANPLVNARPVVRGAAYGLATIAAVVFSAGASRAFIYFQF